MTGFYTSGHFLEPKNVETPVKTPCVMDTEQCVI